jgi:hypothetical protein
MIRRPRCADRARIDVCRHATNDFYKSCSTRLTARSAVGLRRRRRPAGSPAYGASPVGASQRMSRFFLLYSRRKLSFTSHTYPKLKQTWAFAGRAPCGSLPNVGFRQPRAGIVVERTGRRAWSRRETWLDMRVDLFAELTFGKIALQKIAPVNSNFRLYLAGFTGKGNKQE